MVDVTRHRFEDRAIAARLFAQAGDIIGFAQFGEGAEEEQVKIALGAPDRRKNREHRQNRREKGEAAQNRQRQRGHLARLGVYTQDDALLEGIILAQRERAKTLKEMAENSRLFFGDEVILDPKAAEKHLTADAKATLRELRARFASIDNWSAPNIHATLEGLAQEKSLGLGKVAQPLRVAVTGGTVSPPIDATLALLGQPRTLARLDKALA